MASNERQTAPRKLTRANLAAIAGRAAVPGYDRQRLAPAIVHIGVGGFHRAHQAVYLDDLAGQGVVDWGERGVGLLQPTGACWRRSARRTASIPWSSVTRRG